MSQVINCQCIGFRVISRIRLPTRTWVMGQGRVEVRRKHQGLPVEQALMVSMLG